MVFYDDAVELEEIKDTIYRMTKVLDRKITIGKSLEVHINKETELVDVALNRTESDYKFDKRIEQDLATHKYDKFKNEFIKQFGIWEKEEKCLMWLDKQVRHIIYMVAVSYTHLDVYKRQDQQS